MNWTELNRIEDVEYKELDTQEKKNHQILISQKLSAWYPKIEQIPDSPFFQVLNKDKSQKENHKITLEENVNLLDINMIIEAAIEKNLKILDRKQRYKNYKVKSILKRTKEEQDRIVREEAAQRQREIEIERARNILSDESKDRIFSILNNTSEHPKEDLNKLLEQTTVENIKKIISSYQLLKEQKEKQKEMKMNQINPPYQSSIQQIKQQQPFMPPNQMQFQNYQQFNNQPQIQNQIINQLQMPHQFQHLAVIPPVQYQQQQQQYQNQTIQQKQQKIVQLKIFMTNEYNLCIESVKQDIIQGRYQKRPYLNLNLKK